MFHGHWILRCDITHTHTEQGVRFVTGIGFCVLWYRTRDRGYDLLRALRSASCDNTHETAGTTCYRHGVLRLVISHTRQGVDLFRALGSASCDNTHETRGTICYGHWVLHPVISHTKQGVRFVTGIGVCVLWYHTRDKGCILLRALGSASFDNTHKTGGTTCCGHWVLRLAISHTRQGVRIVWALGSVSCDFTHTRRGVRFVTGIGFCILWYHTRDNGYVLLRALGSASCDITHETRGTIFYGHWVLPLVISHTRQGVRFVTGIGFCVLWYHRQDGGYDVLRALGSASCDITHETGDTMGYRPWVLRLVISHTRQGVRVVTGIGFCVLWYHTRDRGYVLLCALVSVSCDVTHETTRLEHKKPRVLAGFFLRVTRRRWTHEVCTLRHKLFWPLHSRCWLHLPLPRRQSHHCTQPRSVATNTPTPPRPSTQLLRLVISHTRQGVRFGTGIGLCVLGYHARDSEYDLLRALGSASLDITEETGVYDLLRALGSAFCDITHETGGTTFYGHWVLRLVISHTRQGVRFARGMEFCVL